MRLSGNQPTDGCRSRFELCVATGLSTAFGVLGAACVAFFVSLLLRHQYSLGSWWDGWMADGIEVVASCICLGHAFRRRSDRIVPAVFGLALLSWSAGDVVATAQTIYGSGEPALGLASVFYLGFYPLAFLALILYVHREATRLRLSDSLDAAIAGLGISAVCAACVFHDIMPLTRSTPAATGVALSYPIGDLLLLSLIVGALTVSEKGRRSTFGLLAAAAAVNVVGDSFDLVHQAPGATGPAVTLAAIAWPVSIVLMSLGICARPASSAAAPPWREPWSLFSKIGGLCGLAVLIIGSWGRVDDVAIALATATLLMAGLRLIQALTEIQQLSRNRQHLAMTDELTGLGNRRHLFEVLEDFFRRWPSSPTGSTMAFLFLDLDRFKEINDLFGHSAGDEMLRQLGPRLATCLRDTDVLVRLGGDEFAAAIFDADSAYATTVAQRLAGALEAPFELGAVTARVSASIGIAIAPEDGGTSADLIWSADVAMYRAKATGMPYAIFERTVDGQDGRLRLLQDLHAALERGQLLLYYQPQLDLSSGRIVGVEALVRWDHPRLGLIAPDRFLPLAVEGGLMARVTAAVLEEAGKQCAAWERDGRNLVVSVNVSASDLLGATFISRVTDLLERYRLAPDRLVLEITETQAIVEFERSQQVIGALGKLGVVVSIDDFGAGFTSLAHLASLPVGEVKLDRSFVSGLSDGAHRDSDLIRASIELAHAMDLRVVVEGIEDQRSLDLLTSFGCDRAQGYLISRPRSAEELSVWLDSSQPPASGATLGPPVREQLHRLGLGQG